MNDITAIFAFLKYCLGSKEDMSGMVAGMNWQELYSFGISPLQRKVLTH